MSVVNLVYVKHVKIDELWKTMIYAMLTCKWLYDSSKVMICS